MPDENSKASESSRQDHDSQPTPAYVVQLPLKQVLLWATAINILLILGGTVYSSFTVSSIEKRYQEAESRINESKSKYQGASEALREQIAKAEHARSDIDSLVNNFGKLEGQLSELQRQGNGQLKSMSDEARARLNELEGQLSELQKEGNGQVKAITDDARAQLDQLKKEKSSIDATLLALESEMKRTIEQDAATIRTEVDKHIRDAKEALRESQERLNVLANEITEQKIKVEVKNKEIQDLQLTANRTLEEVRETDKILKEELRKLQQSRRIDVNMLWEHSDGWLRAIYMTIAALMVFSLVRIGLAPFRKRGST